MNSNIDLLKRQIGKDSKFSPSPLMKWLNPILISVGESKLSFQYLIRKEMTNPIGKLHGGIIAAIIDDTIGATMMAFNEQFICITVNNVIDYYSAAEEGEIIIAETSIIEDESRLTKAQCEVWRNDRSKMIAKGVSKLLKKKK